MKKNVLLVLFALMSAFIQAQSVTLTESSGWLESAYVEWTPVSEADSYNVYYSGNGETDVQIDDPLIRNYGSYFRADVVGLAAGSYTIKVVPVISGSEGTATTTGALTVTAHDRTGFAFSNSRIPGAYKADGTPKSGAVILYITENTKNTIELEVTGANSNPCVGLQTILDGFKKGNDTRPLIVRFIGQITDLSYMLNGDIVCENDNNSSSYITLEGIGEDAVADGWGIRVKNASNVEVRNIGTMNCDSDEGDNIGLQQNNDYIWVHNCDFFYGDAGSDSDQAKGDGALDCKKSTYITFSYNHFWDSGKCNLLGLSEGTTSGLYITYHHNWYDHSDSRHPRVRYYSAHVYNNYYDGNAKYGVGSTEGSSVFVEANYFRNCKYPMLTSMQGTDVYDGDGTFSSEDGGTIKAYNNYMTGQKRFVAYGDSDYDDSDTQFDAYVASSRTETVSSSITSYQGINTYNNFDTNSSIMYSYSADSPTNAVTNVTTYAGRMNGGDFSWTFDNDTDDESYDVNTELKAALVAYSTALVAVQGDGSVVIDDGTDDNDDTSGDVITGDVVHNFTTSGTTSSFFSITGNLSTSKGTVTYGDLTLTQCLKMESSTSITFTTSEASTLVLVFNEDFTGSVYIDGTSYTATAGIVTMDLTAGSHTITKGDSTNLYYISITYSGTDDEVVEDPTLTKQGSGSSIQTVDLGTAIDEFSYGWTNATSATATGLPDGVSATADESAQTITISGTPTEVGTFAFTVTTVGGSTDVSMSGTITVSEVEDEVDDNSVIIQEDETGFCGVDGSIDSENDGYTGTGFANTTNEAGAGIDWYLLADGGTYTLTWAYANGGTTDRTADLIINGTTYTSVSFPATGSWTTWSTTSATISLDYNVYDIRLEATAASGLGNIDYMAISGSSFSIVECGTILETSTSDDTDDAISYEIHNFTESGTTSSFYTISGNLSTSKGTVYYNDLTLTQCLKMESSTSITFTSTSDGTFVLVFNETFAGAIYIDGTSYTASEGVLTVDLTAGNHTITKDETANLYYMSLSSSVLKNAMVSSDVDQTKEASLIIAPNPVVDNFKILTNAEISGVSIYDLSGSLLIKLQGNTTNVNISNLSSGSYIAIIQTTDGAIYKQIIIKK